jgi:hypothetical protein
MTASQRAVMSAGDLGGWFGQFSCSLGGFVFVEVRGGGRGIVSKQKGVGG